MNKIRILVADDHALLRVGLNTMLNTQPDMTVISEACNGLDAITKAKDLRPDVIIMDLMMPKVDGAEATRQIVETEPSAKVIILTSFGTSTELSRAMTNGAVGAQMKGSPIDSLLKSIRMVASGRKAIAPEIKRFLNKEPAPVDLSKRQQEILLAVSHGKTSDSIASDLGISVSAVKQHITATLEKLGAASRAEAVAIATRKQLLKI